MTKMPYTLARNILGLTLPYVLIVVMPRMFGILQIKPEMEGFVFAFDVAFLLPFVSALIYSIFAIVYNVVKCKQE